MLSRALQGERHSPGAAQGGDSRGGDSRGQQQQQQHRNKYSWCRGRSNQARARVRGRRGRSGTGPCVTGDTRAHAGGHHRATEQRRGPSLASPRHPSRPWPVALPSRREGAHPSPARAPQDEGIPGVCGTVPISGGNSPWRVGTAWHGARRALPRSRVLPGAIPRDKPQGQLRWALVPKSQPHPCPGWPRCAPAPPHCPPSLEPEPGPGQPRMNPPSPGRDRAQTPPRGARD